MPLIPDHLLEVASSRRQADAYIENGRVLNVYTGELLTGVGVAIAAGRIAYVGSGRGMVGPQTTMIDAGDGILVPGYVEAHSHFDLIISMGQAADVLIPRGTTTIVNDTLAMAGRFGAAGLAYLKASTAELSLNVFYTVSASGLAPELEDLGYPAGAKLSAEELAAWLTDDTVLGTGESLPWRTLLAGDRRIMARLAMAQKERRLHQGHFPGARADHLQALAAAGFTDCHEALTAQEALERLRAGMHVILRHGPARSDLPALAPLFFREGVDRSRLMFTTDWTPPGDLMTRGHLDHVIGTALELGVSPVDAYRMATLNPARYLGLEERIGAIAPRRQADILCLHALENPTPQWVMTRGFLAARGGRVIPRAGTGQPAATLPPFRPPIPRATAESFLLAVNGTDYITVAAIELVDKTVTRRKNLVLPVRDGAVSLDGLSEKVLKIAMPRPEGDGFTIGFVVGVGAPLGGFSTSVASDPYNTLVIGCSDHDMAAAYNRMVDLGGGIVGVHGGSIAAELPLPVGGFISDAPVAAVAEGIEGLNAWGRSSGSTIEDLFLFQRYFTYVGVPFFRMTPWGIYDVKEQRVLPSYEVKPTTAALKRRSA